MRERSALQRQPLEARATAAAAAAPDAAGAPAAGEDSNDASMDGNDDEPTLEQIRAFLQQTKAHLAGDDLPPEAEEGVRAAFKRFQELGIGVPFKRARKA